MLQNGRSNWRTLILILFYKVYYTTTVPVEIKFFDSNNDNKLPKIENKLITWTILELQKCHLNQNRVDKTGLVFLKENHDVTIVPKTQF